MIRWIQPKVVVSTSMIAPRPTMIYGAPVRSPLQRRIDRGTARRRCWSR
jgi:hypothetical protein